MAMPPEICPVCGADVPPKARACPECGADEETGWSERAEVQRLGLPDDEFDYDQFVKEEFGGAKREVRPRGISMLWWIVAIVLLIATALYLVRAF
jgi:predicted nucleic acid-binding Zn ribbon protein